MRGLPSNISKNTELRRTSKNDDESWKSLWDKSLERIPLELVWSGSENSPLSVKTVINEQTLKVETEEILVKANQKGLDEGPIQKVFDVIGEEFKTSYHNFELLEKKLFISASSLKSLKRELNEKLSEQDVFSFANACQQAQQQSFGGASSDMKVIICNNNLNKEKSQKYPIRLRLWNNIEFLTDNIKADCFVVPWQQRNRVSNRLNNSQVSYWLPPILNSKQFKEIYDELKTLETGSFLCFGWEAFRLAKLLPQLRFELDWCFNLANINSLVYIREKGLDAVISKEWKDEVIPENLNFYKASLAWNPLVSYTRFNGAIKSNQIVSNSHKDYFFTLPIGNGVTAMFLENKPGKISKHHLPLQLDIAISPDEDPKQVIKRLFDSKLI